MLLAQQRWLRRRAREGCSRAFAAVSGAGEGPVGTAGAARCVATPPVEAAVPFELSPSAARAKFDAWCSLWDESNRECSAVAAQLPFWAFDAVADVRYRGMVGFKSGSKGGMRWVAVLDWKPLNGALHRSEACAQTYASFDLRRDHVAAAACGHHASRAVPSAVASGGDALPPYQMGRGLAWALARRHMESELRARAAHALRASAGADDVRDLECEIRFTSVQSHAVRLPAYVVRYTHGTILSDDQSKSITPERFAAVIGGVTGAVGAERLFSPNKARAAAVAPAAALALLAQLMAATPQAATAAGLECAFLGAIAAVLAGVAAKRLPYNWHATAEGTRLRQVDGAFEALRAASSGANEWTDEALQRARDAAEWQRWEETGLWRWDARGRADWARTLLRGQAERARERRRWRAMRAAEAFRAEEAERRSAAKQERWGDDWARGTPATPTGPQDPLGYYRLLGLSDKIGVATEEEIKVAFRSRAQELHPDKHAASNAAASADAFRELQAAYVVLRDPRQRKLYCQRPDA